MRKKNDVFGRPLSNYDTFVNQLYNAVNTNAVAWGIPAPVLAAILLLLTPFNTFYAISKMKATATSVDRSNTRSARKVLTAALRPFVQKWIYLNELMTDADIISCGLSPRDKTKTPVPIPDTEPDMYLKPLTSHNIKGFYRQPEEAPGSRKRGKPIGVKSVKVAYFIGENPPVEPDDYGKFLFFTTTTGVLSFAAADKGKPVTIASCWVNEKEQSGDWCEPQTMSIP